MNLQEFRKQWAGRTFRCKLSGETFTIPDDVRFKEFFEIGDSFIDVGDGLYYRQGGKLVEITGEEK